MEELTTLTQAKELDLKIKSNAQIAQGALWEMCKCLAEMRDSKLYKQLGYDNFEDYTEQEIGMTRKQAYHYISVFDNLGENVTSRLQNIGITKLHLLSRLDEQEREEVINTVAVEDVTVKKLEEEIKALKDASRTYEKRTTEKFAALKAAHAEEIKVLKNDSETYERQRDGLAKKLDQSRAENAQLCEQIQELENRPVEVAVTDNSQELEKETKRLQEELFNADCAHKKEIKTLREEYEKQIAEMQKLSESSEADDMQVFKAYLANAVSSAKALAEFIKSHQDSKNIAFFREKSALFFKGMGNQLKGGD